MRLLLADSLEHIAERAIGTLTYDFSRLQAIIVGLRSGKRYPCSTFGMYADIVLAICNGEYDAALDVLEELALEEPIDQPRRVLSLDDPQHRKNVARFIRSMSSDPNMKFSMAPPPEALAREFMQRFNAGHRLMLLAIPDLASEFDALVNDVIMVIGDEKADYQFDGGSSYFLWGALFLNASSHKTEIAMVEVMAHESAHMLLYGCAAEEALVSNSDDELFPSPLRRDLRPMDGIYHATFVSARMHWAMDQLIKSRLLDHSALAEAERARADDLKNFWSGYEVVARHGKLTKTGTSVMQSALDYMSSIS